MNQFLIDRLESLNVILDENMVRQFQSFYEILLEWNKVMNLTAITEYEDVVEKHFLDSLSVKNVLDLSGEKNVIDVGTGAGFPGIPLKIVYPGLRITLLDSLNKRVKFLNEVIVRLGLENIEAIHGRAEDLARREDCREQYDFCVSRAVADLSVLSEYCLPFVKKGGVFVAYKSGEIDEELIRSGRAVSLLGGKVEETVKFQLPGTEIRRAFVKIKKAGITPKKYPRKAGLPSKEPL